MTYTYDMGTLVYKEMSQSRTSFNVDSMVEGVETEATIAIAEVLSFLKLAMEKEANDIIDVMLKEPKFVRTLTLSYLRLEALLCSMLHPNSIIIIPDSSIADATETSMLNLRNYDYDYLSGNAQSVPMPAILSLVWMENEHDRIATGHFDGPGLPGTYIKSGDPELESYLIKIAESFVGRICY